MNQQINVYYIPKNPYILKGSIYTLYINNNTNSDLSSIISQETKKQSQNIIISEQDYTRLLELNNLATQLTSKRTTSIQNFLNEETKTIAELTKINTEKQELVKRLTKRKDEQQ